MIARDRGLVLRTLPLRETSKIVSVLSRTHGKLRLVARGVRGPNSRAGSSLEVGNELDFVFSQKPNRDLGQLREVTLARGWLTDAGRLEVLGLAWAVFELLERLLPEGGPEGGHREPEGVILEDLSRYLAALHQSSGRADALLLFYGFELVLLERLGLQPDLACCRVCGSVPAGAIWLDVAAASCACAGCYVASPHEFELPKKPARLLRHLLESPLDAPTPESDAPTRRLLGLAVHRLLARHLERYRYPRSLRLLRSVDVASDESAPSGAPPSHVQVAESTPDSGA